MGLQGVPSLDDVPRTAHYAIIELSAPAGAEDRRGWYGLTRQVPPPAARAMAHARRVLTYTPYASRAEWEARIAWLTANKADFRAIEAEPLVAEATVTARLR